MHKTIKIIIAALALLTALLTGGYYLFDGDPTTNPDIEQIIDKGKDLYDAIKTEAPAADVDVSPAPAAEPENSAFAPSYETWTDATAVVINADHRRAVLMPATLTREGA